MLVERIETCPDCKGKKVDKDGKQCPTCHGLGILKKKIDIKEK